MARTNYGHSHVEWEIKWSFFSGGRELPSPSKRTTVLFFVAMKIRNDELQKKILAFFWLSGTCVMLPVKTKCFRVHPIDFFSAE